MRVSKKKLQGIWSTHTDNNLSYLEVPAGPNSNPKECEQWRIIEMPNKIEEKILERNQQHFGQAEGTPMTSAVFKTSLGYK